MLLEDFSKHSRTQFNRLNRMLESQFGVKISAKTNVRQLESIQAKLRENIQSLKLRGSVANHCPELSKNLLILEGVNSLYKQRLDELRVDFSTSGPYLRVIDWLSDFIARNVEVGDDIEDATNQAMKEYRSSKWRFPDDVVRFDAQKKAAQKLHHGGEHAMDMRESVEECSGPMYTLEDIAGPDHLQGIKVFIMDPHASLDPESLAKVHDFYTSQGMGAPDDCDHDEYYFDRLTTDCGEELRGEMELDEWGEHLRAKKDAHGWSKLGTDKSDKREFKLLDPAEKERASKLAGNFSLEPIEEPDTAGQHWPTIKRKKLGDSMQIKENLVKQLRALLEAEVDEAEIIIAVKGISKSVQEMIEKIGRVQNEDLPPLSDQVRTVYDDGTANQVQQSTAQALQSVMDALYAAKEAIDGTVGQLATGEAPMNDMDMGMEPEMDAEPEPGLEAGADLGAEPMGDEFGAAETEEPLGRAAKESIQYKRNQLAEMKARIAKMEKRLAEAKAK